MHNFPAWQFDEMNQVGKDYADVAEVAEFDACHGKYRDLEKEHKAIIDTLAIQEHQSVIDFGAGTGAFALQVASCSRTVYAVDVSQAMLGYAQQKAARHGVSNIVFCQGGFLTYQHDADPVDRIVTSLALHHLPDFWKSVALSRLHAMLKSDGRLFIYDVVYSERNYKANISKWISRWEALGGREAVEDVEGHIREEYSTFSWIMEALLEKAGFRIDTVHYDQGVFAQYVCTKMTG